jgi:hypothetical protein
MEIAATEESVPAFIWILPSFRKSPELHRWNNAESPAGCQNEVKVAKQVKPERGWRSGREPWEDLPVPEGMGA